MKYLLMIYGNDDLWASFAPEVMQQAVADTEAFQAELKASGEWIAAYGVADQVNCKTITVKDGTLLVTDGPYIEAKEYLGSFDIIDCESLERALEIAAAVPFARIGSVELRPLMARIGEQRVTDGGRVEDLLRPFAPQVLGSLVRRYGTFDECEDAVQEALLAAAQQWPLDGVPANPAGGSSRSPTGGSPTSSADAVPADGGRRPTPWRRHRCGRGCRTRPTTTSPPSGTTRCGCCSCAATRLSPRRRRSPSRCGPSAG